MSLTATGGVLEQFSDSGLGVLGASGDADADEINNIQQITISFAGPTKIDQFTVSKLFFEGPVGAEYNEVGAYSVDGGANVHPVHGTELESPGSDYTRRPCRPGRGLLCQFDHFSDRQPRSE